MKLYLRSPVAVAFAAAVAFYLRWHAVFAAPLLLLFLFFFIKKKRGAALFAFALAAGVLTGSVCRWRVTRSQPHMGISAGAVERLGGTLREDSRLISRNRTLYVVRASSVGSRNLSAGAGGDINVIAKNPAPQLFLGTTVECSGSAAEGEGGDFVFYADAVFEQSAPMRLFRLRGEARSAVFSYLRSRYRSNARGLLLTLLMGMEEDISPELKENYRLSGCSHILALSGFHVGILAMIILFLFKPVFGSRHAFVASALIMGGYLFLIGLRPSLLRAVLMFWMMGGCRFLNLRSDPLKTIACGFLLQLVLLPGSGESLSFQLSYLALTGLILFTRRFSRLLPKRIPVKLRLGLGASLAAQTAAFPVMAVQFGVVYPVGIVAALVLTPLITLFVWGSLALLPLSPFAPLNRPLQSLLDLFYRINAALVSLMSRAPVLPLENYGVLALCTFILFSFIMVSYRQEIRRFVHYAGKRLARSRFGGFHQGVPLAQGDRRPSQMGTEFSDKPRDAGADSRSGCGSSG